MRSRGVKPPVTQSKSVFRTAGDLFQYDSTSKLILIIVDRVTGHGLAGILMRFKGEGTFIKGYRMFLTMGYLIRRVFIWTIQGCSFEKRKFLKIS
jgi:hypothetical protein